VVAWDPRPSALEATRRTVEHSGLTNVTLHEHPDPPSPRSGALADFVVLRDVLDTTSDRLRGLMLAMAGSAVRPGGLVCATYRTTVGHTEYLPVIALIRYVASRHAAGSVPGVIEALSLLQRMRDGGAGYLTTRPRVAEWFEELLAVDPATVAEQYVLDDFRPLSHATVNGWMQQFGCRYVGSARPTDELDLGVPDALREMIATAGSPDLREAYRDLALRREQRCDVYRLGECPMTVEDVAATLELHGVPAVGRALDEVRRSLEADDVA